MNATRFYQVVCGALLSCALPASAVASLPEADDLNEGSEIVFDSATQSAEFWWFGKAGRTYFLQTTPDLNEGWIYFDEVISGENAPLARGFAVNSDKFFARLRYTDQPTLDPEGDDFDGDTISNLDEVYQDTDPFGLNDLNENGIPDDWETFWSDEFGVFPDTVKATLEADQSTRRRILLNNPVAPGADFTVTVQGAQIGGSDHYVFEDSATGDAIYSWDDISATGTILATVSSADDGVEEIPLGDFDIPFYENEYDRIFVSSNGRILFDSSSSSFDNKRIPDTDSYEPFIAPFWDDLSPASGGTVYFREYADRLTIQFDAVSAYNGAGPYTFQAVLHEDGRIDFFYKNMPNTFDSATIGIEGNYRDADGLQIAFNENYVQDGLAVNITREPEAFVEVTPRAGTVGAAGVTSLDVLFKAFSLAPGIYDATIGIAHTGTGTSPWTIPAILEVANQRISDQPITVAVTYLEEQTTLWSDEAITLQATVNDTESEIERVEFLVNGNKVGEDLSGHYSFEWDPLSGFHSITARSVNQVGETKSSEPLMIHVVGDEDGDRMEDGWEIETFGGLSEEASADFDGDGFPNIIEYHHGTNAGDSVSVPVFSAVQTTVSPIPEVGEVRYYRVDGISNTDFEKSTIRRAIAAAGDFDIIEVLPNADPADAGVYRERLTVSKRVYLFGSAGARRTIVDVGSFEGRRSLELRSESVISGLTFRGGNSGIYNGGGAFIDIRDDFIEPRFLGCRFINNEASRGGAIFVAHGNPLFISCTITDNRAATGAALYNNSPLNEISLINTLLWNPGLAPEIAGAVPEVSLDHTLTRDPSTGKVLIDGVDHFTDDPGLGYDYGLTASSPGRDAGTLAIFADPDADGESFADSQKDIGADEFADSDTDGLPDWFEATGITDPSADPDGDGLDNLAEYQHGTESHLADTDGDELSDNAEVNVHGSDPLEADMDQDEIPDGWEIVHGLDPVNPDDAFADPDGDRVPNLWEYHLGGTDPNDPQWAPTATHLVAADGTGDSLTLQDAYNAAGDLEIIAVKAGVYHGRIRATGSKRIVWLGEAGGDERVIVMGPDNSATITLYADTIIDGFAITHADGQTGSGFYARNAHVRVLNSAIYGNTASSGAVCNRDAIVELVHCTLFDNEHAGDLPSIYHEDGASFTRILNSILWNPSATAAELGTDPTQYEIVNSIIRGGQHGGLNVDPLLTADGWLTASSPARNRIGTRFLITDIHGEIRPVGTVDLGWDHFMDSDADGLPDRMESSEVTMPSGDADGDGLTNHEEYELGTDPIVADTDGDEVSDGDELEVHGTDPLGTDTDGDEMDDGWEITHGFDPLDPEGILEDPDGDRVPNLWEYHLGTDPGNPMAFPAPTRTVAADGTADHATPQEAYNASEDLEIVAVEAGLYQGKLHTSGSKRILWLGEPGSPESVVLANPEDSETVRIYADTVIDGFVITHADGQTGSGLYVSDAQVRLVNCAITGNNGVIYTNNAIVELIYCTLFANESSDSTPLIYHRWGESFTRVINSILWNPLTTAPELGTDAAQYEVINSIVRGGQQGGIDQDPQLTPNGWLTATSPARNRNGVHLLDTDIHGETRPAGIIDLGWDQFVDSDADGLPDWLEALGATTPSGDADQDGMDNLPEYKLGTDPVDADTDGDGLSDGDEVNLHDSDPLEADMDGDDMADGWETLYGLNPLDPDDAFTDPDGDRVPNLWESRAGTAPDNPFSLPAPDRVVAPDGSADHTTLQQAYNVADDLEIIAVKAGVYQEEIDADDSKRILWMGETGIDGQVVVANPVSSYTVSLNADTVIDGFAITHVPGESGGGLRANNATVRLVNTAIHGNADSYGAAIYNDEAFIELIHCTLFDNKSSTSNPLITNGGRDSFTRIINSIVWNSSQTAPELGPDPAHHEVVNSIVRGGQHGGIDQDPLLAFGGWLTSASPARSQSGNQILTTDIDGETRPAGTVLDLGWDQFLDSDADGLPDRGEANGISDPSGDFDGDALLNLDEYETYGTPPHIADVDSDGLDDGTEIALDTDFSNPDSDGDELLDGVEIQVGMDPTLSDTAKDLDNDGLSNATELELGTDLLVKDSDDDGIFDGMEANLTYVAPTGGRAPLDPLDPETQDGTPDGQTDGDGDALTVVEEIAYGTDPTTWDTDGDLLSDDWEINQGLNPSSSSGLAGANGDPDGDGLVNLQELIHGTHPTISDSDGDGVDDGDEVNQASDPGNADDEGKPPPQDEIIAVPFSVGDSSDSHSERWRLDIEATGPEDYRHFGFVSPDFGEVGTQDFKLRKGNGYRITVSHIATDRPSPDYDYEAQINGKPSLDALSAGATHNQDDRFFAVKNHWLVDNKDGLLGKITNFNDNPVPGKEAVMIPMDVLPDVTRDGVIDESDRGRVTETEPFRFWINDDSDSGEVGGDDIPGQGSADADSIWGNPGIVNGMRDLVDFFPVFIDLGEVLARLDNPSSVELKLSGTGLRFLNYPDGHPGLGPWEAGRYLREPQTARELASAISWEISDDPSSPTSLGSDFVEKVGQGKGILLLESYAQTHEPLMLHVFIGGSEILRYPLPLRMSSVEAMFEHRDLTHVPTEYDGSPAEISVAPAANRASAPNWPDSLTNNKTFVFVHGYNVNGQEARGWHAEIFKRLHQMGSNARFVGVTWNGDTGLDYHKAVFQAFQSGDALGAALSGYGNITIAAHSLGNMVVSHAIQNGGFVPDRYYMINAAVPIEAYDYDSIEPDMIEADWTGTDPGFYASTWHTLFNGTSDNRVKLTWRDRFFEILEKRLSTISSHPAKMCSPNVLAKTMRRFLVNFWTVTLTFRWVPGRRRNW